MKKYVSILLVLLVVAALSVSGCTVLGGNQGGKATATPTTNPGTTEPGATDSPAVQPTTTPGTSLEDTLGSLYQEGKFTWIEYTTVMSMEGMEVKTTMKMEMLGNEMHEGKMMDHTRITINGNAQDYWSDPNEAGDSSSDSGDFSSSDAKLTNAGLDTVTINGKTYACTKYTVTMTNEGEEAVYTFWAAPAQAPAPVQYQFDMEGVTMTSQLTGWG